MAKKPIRDCRGNKKKLKDNGTPVRKASQELQDKVKNKRRKPQKNPPPASRWREKINRTIGLRLKEALAFRGVYQIDFYEWAGWTKRKFRTLLEGTGNAKVNDLLVVCLFLEVSMDWLVGLVDDYGDNTLLRYPQERKASELMAKVHFRQERRKHLRVAEKSASKRNHRREEKLAAIREKQESERLAVEALKHEEPLPSEGTLEDLDHAPELMYSPEEATFDLLEDNTH